MTGPAGPAGEPWWHALPALETWIPCGESRHPVRWDAGRLSLPAHPDAEGELVFAALGGTKAACVEVAEAWHRHAADLVVLALGPRGPADRVNVTWDDVTEFRSAGPGRRPVAGSAVGRRFPRLPPGLQPGRPVIRSGPAGPRMAAPARPVPATWRQDLERDRGRQLDLLLLLALGRPFQMVLSGLVAASWAGGALAAGQPADRAAVEAALTGRLAPAAAGWLGIDPDRVEARLHEGAGWGHLEVTGTGEARHLQARLPARWLAAVWACGLAVADGHLVVAVQRAAWPGARVLAVPAPGRDPVALHVRATGDADGPGHRAHWEIASDPAGPGAEDGPAPPEGKADPS